MDVLLTKTLKAIKEKLHGLPSICRLVTYELIEYLNIETGCVKLDKTLAQLVSDDFFVDLASGRKQDLITSETIRNAFRTIKKFRGEYFLFRTENQRIVIELPFIRELYEKHTKSKEVTAEVATDVASARTLAETNGNANLTHENTKENTGEVTAVTSPNKEYIYNKHNSNKQTSCDEKLPISKNFYPSAETISEAQEQGFLKVTDPEEIKAFIEHNQAQESRWEDFNAIFLCWLEKCFSHKPKQTQQAARTTGNYNNVCNISKKTNPNEESKRLNREIISQSEANEQQQLPNYFG